MKVSALVLFFKLINISTISFAQNPNYKSIPFAKPIDFPLDLAGCFAEPRPAHFHSGIDIKTNEKEGFPVYSIYDGYISRIKVSAFGYGKALYITHTNGYTSVYGHLSKFTDDIEKLVHDEIYKQKLSEIDIYPSANQLKVKKGQQVAFSGNTGGSTGPHLHFEIRDTKTEMALNPLLFNYEYKDSKAPTLSEVKIYGINGSYYNAQTQSYKLIKKENYFTTAAPIIVTNAQVGISLKGYDAQDNSTNKNGIYRITVLNAKDTVFQFTQDKIDFQKTRAVAAFVDFEEQCTSSLDNYMCFRLQNNPLSIYDKLVNNGLITVRNGDTISVEIRCYDANLNSTIIKLTFIGNKIAASTKAKNDFAFNKTNYLRKKHCQITFPENSFYDNVSLNYSMDSAKDKTLYSVINKVGSKQFIPLHRACHVEVMSKKLPTADKNKACIVRKNWKGKEVYLNAQINGNWLSADSKELGDFYIKTDKELPQIVLLNAKSDSFSNQHIIAKISDTLSGIKSYNAYIDGQWVNFYYDAKEDTIDYKMDEYCKSGTHELKIIVTDNVNNQTIFTKTFKN